jgi:tetratricopeptide (TPR) repeat protein
MKKTALLLLLAFICGNSFAQTSPDSLKVQLERVEGTDRTTVLVDLVESLYEAEPVNAIDYARLALSRLDADDERLNRVLYWQGLAHVRTGGSGLDSAWALSEQLLQRAESSGDVHLEGDAHDLASRIHHARGDLDESLNSALAAADGYEDANVLRGRVVALRQAGYLVGFEFSLDEEYRNQVDFDRGLSYLEEALSLASEAGDKALTADVLFGMGLIERGRSETELHALNSSDAADQGVLPGVDTDPHAVAASRFEQSVAIFKELKDYRMIESAYGNLITMYYNTNDLDDVLKHANQLLDYMEAEDQLGPSSYALFFIASVQRTRSEYDNALATWHRILAIDQETGNRADIARSYGTIGFIHKQQGEFVEALSNYSGYRGNLL